MDTLGDSYILIPQDFGMIPENWRISSPPISPVLAAPKCSNTHIVLKRKSSDNV